MKDAESISTLVTNLSGKTSRGTGVNAILNSLTLIVALWIVDEVRDTMSLVKELENRVWALEQKVNTIQK